MMFAAYESASFNTASGIRLCNHEGKKPSRIISGFNTASGIRLCNRVSLSEYVYSMLFQYRKRYSPVQPRKSSQSSRIYSFQYRKRYSPVQL